MGPLPTPDPSIGVFETLLVVDGGPIELDRHLARLDASVDDLYGLDLPHEAGDMVRDGARDIELGRLRLDARPDAAGLALDVRAVAIDAAILLPPWERGAELAVAVVSDWRGAHKWGDRALLDSLDAAAAPATALLVDAGGAVLETTRANVFVVRPDGSVATPPADGRILPGVTRQLAIEIARASGVEVVEADLTRADVDAAREVFTTGSVRGVEPVRSIDGRTVGGPDPGVAATIAAALRERWLGDRRAATGEPAV
jgi:para-aminobenzoate synthetase / 4-amino-4-deoxychorismate lyase